MSFDGNPFITCKKPFKNIQTQPFVQREFATCNNLKAQHFAPAFSFFPPFRALCNIGATVDVILFILYFAHLYFSIMFLLSSTLLLLTFFLFLLSLLPWLLHSLIRLWCIESLNSQFAHFNIQKCRIFASTWSIVETRRSARANCAKICYPWKRKCIDFFLSCLALSWFVSSSLRY